MHICKVLDYGKDFPDWTRLPCQTYDEMNAQSIAPWGDWFLGYPLTLQDHVYGVLLVREINTSPVFWERRLEILNGIAQQVSLAIQNDLYKQELVQTERIEREMQLARQIQETFLPESLPRLEDWDLDLRWEPAREVGGDFYDCFLLDDQRIGLVIADVADKGIPAAMYMTVARTLIRANAASGQLPADVMQAVNKLLVSDSDDAMFITAIYAILIPATGELIFANAGHNLPLVYRQAEQQVEQAPKGGTALGVLNDLHLENQRILIQPGDVLFLFTDGVTDLLSPDNLFFGDQRLHDLLQEYGSKPVNEMLDLLDDAFIEFRRGLAPIDDITLLAVRRMPAEPGEKKAA
jgi:phosphoserine phosphatase RsbU/P